MTAFAPGGADPASPTERPEPPELPEEGLPWYAVRVRSNFEETVTAAVQSKGYEVFSPAYDVKKRRKDRVVRLRAPLFPGYVFCRFRFDRRLPILMAPGVVHVVTAGKQPLAVPDHEIESIKRLSQQGGAVAPCPFVQAGDIVRITSGPLAGLEGVLLESKSGARMALSITLLQRSISAEVDAECLRFVRRGPLTLA